jgi:hypothetical protein
MMTLRDEEDAEGGEDKDLGDLGMYSTCMTLHPLHYLNDWVSDGSKMPK